MVVVRAVVVAKGVVVARRIKGYTSRIRAIIRAAIVNQNIVVARNIKKYTIHPIVRAGVVRQFIAA